MNLFKNIQIPDAFSRFRLQRCCLFTDCKFAIAHGQQMSKWAIKLLENFIFFVEIFCSARTLGNHIILPDLHDSPPEKESICLLDWCRRLKLFLKSHSHLQIEQAQPYIQSWG